jgi:murein DD-endopeptidase MepM/ murein hydrolase activator NlpD
MLFKKSKNILILAFAALFTLNVACATDASRQAVQIEQRREEAAKTVQRLRLLERIETNKLYRNQQRLEQNAQSLHVSKQRFTSAQTEIADLRVQLAKAQEEYAVQRVATNKRIVQIFKTKRRDYISFLLSARDLNNLLDRIYFENIIMKQDKQRLREMQVKTRRIRELQTQIESQRNFLEVNIKTIDRQQKNIQQAIDQNEKLIERLRTDRATWERSERELARQSVAIAEMINRTQSRETTTITVTGGFVQPAPGRVSSPYGNRMHPVFKRPAFHAGIDIAAPMNTEVKAAQSGRVIFAGWYGGYGKVVIIDHGRIDGKPTTTLYAHLNRYRVDVGTNVIRGQVIGNVGTTGYSTGPHLHFEVRVSGNTVNPLNYVRY